MESISRFSSEKFLFFPLVVEDQTSVVQIKWQIIIIQQHICNICFAQVRTQILFIEIGHVQQFSYTRYKKYYKLILENY